MESVQLGNIIEGIPKICQVEITSEMRFQANSKNSSNVICGKQSAL